jgi:hypothetical protein
VLAHPSTLGSAPWRTPARRSTNHPATARSPLRALGPAGGRTPNPRRKKTEGTRRAVWSPIGRPGATAR